MWKKRRNLRIYLLFEANDKGLCVLIPHFYFLAVCSQVQNERELVIQCCFSSNGEYFFPWQKWNQLNPTHSAVAHNRVHDVLTLQPVCFDGTTKKRACHSVTARYKTSWNYLCCDVLGVFLLSNKKSRLQEMQQNSWCLLSYANQTPSCECQLMMENSSKVDKTLLECVQCYSVSDI